MCSRQEVKSEEGPVNALILLRGGGIIRPVWSLPSREWIGARATDAKQSWTKLMLILRFVQISSRKASIRTKEKVAERHQELIFSLQMWHGVDNIDNIIIKLSFLSAAHFDFPASTVVHQSGLCIGSAPLLSRTFVIFCLHSVWSSRLCFAFRLFATYRFWYLRDNFFSIFFRYFLTVLAAQLLLCHQFVNLPM